MDRATVLRWAGGGALVLGASFLVPFVEAAINDRRVDLWRNPLFLAPLAACVVGLAAIALSFRRPRTPADMNEMIRREARRAKREAGQRKPLAREPGRNYDARPRHELVGQGPERALRVTLHEIGDGWDRGVRADIRGPSGQRAEHIWQGLDAEGQRQRVAEEGLVVNAAEPGVYLIQWWGEVGPGIKPPLITWQEVHIPELEDCIQGGETMRLAWPAALAVGVAGPGIWLELHGPENDERQTVRCTVEGPSGTWQTDNTTVFMPAHQMGPRPDFRFLFPNHFPDGPDAPLERGEYQVLWEGDEEGLGWQTICRDCFRVEGDILDCKGEKIEADPMLAE